MQRRDTDPTWGDFSRQKLRSVLIPWPSPLRELRAAELNGIWIRLTALSGFVKMIDK